MTCYAVACQPEFVPPLTNVRAHFGDWLRWRVSKEKKPVVQSASTGIGVSRDTLLRWCRAATFEQTKMSPDNVVALAAWLKVQPAQVPEIWRSEPVPEFRRQTNGRIEESSATPDVAAFVASLSPSQLDALRAILAATPPVPPSAPASAPAGYQPTVAVDLEPSKPRRARRGRKVR